MKKLLSLTALLLLVMIALFSCKSGGTDELPEGEYIFAPGSSVTVICNSPTKSVNELAGTVAAAVGNDVLLATDAAPKAEHEIVIGETSRELSRTAYRLLERIKDDDGDLVGYVVYSDGNSLAVAYDSDLFGLNIAETRAFDYIIGELIGDKQTLTVNKGRVAALAFNPIDYVEQLEDAEQEAKWVSFENELSKITDNSKEIVEAYKYYYDTVCTDDVVYWLADLYDSDIGGFYFSNSGRDNEGFLPDVESTSQAVGFFKSTGMVLHDVDFPEWFSEQIVAYVKGLQDPDGYFYHPQWNREELAANTQRMGRDLNSSEGLLERFGASPTYDTANGMKGDGLLADGTPVSAVTPASYYGLTTPLLRGSGSVASLVSKVVPTAAISGFEMLESVDAFTTYLDELAARNELAPTDSKYRSFYQIANEVTTFSSQVLAKDEANGNKVYSNILINWMNEQQDKETGLYDEGLAYANTNAYYKAINVYNRLQAPVPLADKAIESTIKILMSDEPVDVVLYTFNVWGSLNQTMQNLNKYAKTAEAMATRDAARKKLLELAPEAVRATANIQLLFKKSDGSFSYLIGENTSVSQMMKVAVPNTDEGDVNSTTLTMGGILHGMLETMGIKGIAPTCFTEADGLRCFKRISENGTIIKKDSTIIVDYVTFDGDDIGSTPILGVTSNLSGGSFKVVSAPREDDPANKAAEFDTALAYESLSVPTSSVTPSSTCYVFESDFCVPEDTPDGEIQILMQNAVYMTTINKTGNEVRVWESSSRKPDFAKRTELDAVAQAGEWFNLKMEFYPGDKNSVRAKIYFNGKLVAVTDNYFDDTGAKLSGDIEPRTYYEFVNIIAVSTCDTTLLLDNVAAYATSVPYEKERGLEINVDAPANKRVVHGFENTELPKELSVTQNSGTVALTDSSDGQGKALSLTGGGKGIDLSSQYKLELPINRVSTGSKVKVAVFESDIYISADEAAGTKLRMHLLENNSLKQSMASFDLTVESGTDGKFVRIVPSPNGKPSSPIQSIKLPTGTSFKLRLEYYEEEFCTLIYVDGTLMAMSTAISKDAKKSSAGLLELTTAKDAGGTVLLDNIVFEKDEMDFLTSAAPKEASVVRNFSSADSLTALSGGAALSSGAVMIGAVGAQMKSSLTDRGVVFLASRYTSDVAISSNSDGTYRFMLHAEDGTPITAFDLVIKGRSVSVREYYAGGVGTTLSKTSLKENTFSLTFKYYFEERMTEIFINGTHVATNTLTYLFDNDTLTVDYVTVSKVEGAGSISIDNLIMENTLEFALGTTAADGVMAPVNGTDFENSYYGNPAAGITYEPISIGSQLGVKGLEVGEDDGGEPIYSKFLALKTLPGGNDTVRFSITSDKMLSKAKSVVVETDIALVCDDTQSSSAVELYLFSKDGKTMAWYSSVTFAKNGGSVTVSDYNAVAGSSVSSVRLATEGNIFKLRLEYALTETGITVNMFVNGEYICSSTNMYRTLESPIAPNNIGGFRFYTANASSGYVLIDNFKIYQSDTLTDIGDSGNTGGDSGNTGDDSGNTGDDSGNTGGDSGGSSDGGYTGPSTQPPKPVITPGDNPDKGFDDIGQEPTAPDNGSDGDDYGWTERN